jgi:predicted Rossmann fold nucleotide-binding protein DprA/Smf involved in DNA uptake
MNELEYFGNKDLLNLPKTAFLASNTISSETVLRCYDWATEMRRQGRCVVSGFSSKLEKDVLHFLLKGNQPIIMVLARQMYKVVPTNLKEALEQNRLLIISTSQAVRQSRATALARNRYVCEMADEIMLVGAAEGNSLFVLTKQHKEKIMPF